MKNHLSFALVILSIMFVIQSCELAEGIFKVGFGLGIFVVVMIAVLLLFLAKRFRR